MTHVKRIFLATLLLACGLVTQAQAAAINLITPGDEFDGTGTTLGFKFTVLNNTTLTSLGVYDSGMDGLSERAQVGLWDADGNLLASTFIPAGIAAELDGFFRYQSVAGVALLANTEYIVGAYLADTATSYSTGGGGTATIDANVVIVHDRFYQDTSFTYPVDTEFNQGAWLGANFRAELPDDNGSVPEPGSIALLGLGCAGLLAARRRSARR